MNKLQPSYADETYEIILSAHVDETYEIIFSKTPVFDRYVENCNEDVRIFVIKYFTIRSIQSMADEKAGFGQRSQEEV